MKKRWLIRSLFLLPLVCVVGLWVTSYFAGLDLERAKAGRAREICIVQGQSWVRAVNDVRMGDVPLTHHIFREATVPGWLSDLTTLGFYAGHRASVMPFFLIAFPLWLPTLLLLALNWFVWRKTKAKYNGKAFLIEPAKPGESKS